MTSTKQTKKPLHLVNTYLQPKNPKLSLNNPLNCLSSTYGTISIPPKLSTISKIFIIFLQTDISSKSPMSPTKKSEIYNPVDYSSMAPTEVLSNNDNSSGGGGLEPNEVNNKTTIMTMEKLQTMHNPTTKNIMVS